MNHPTNEHGLLQEIEEDLQRQKFEELWRKFGPYILGAAAAIVLVTAMITGWQTYQTRQSQKVTEALWRVVDKDFPSDEERRAAFETYAKENDGKVQAFLARLYATANLAQAGDKAKALEAYDAMAADRSVEETFRQMATLLAVQMEMDSGDPAKLQEKLQPLMANKGPWAAMAHEYAGHLALRTGDKEKAKAQFFEVMGIEHAPEAVTQRSSVMLEWLKQGE